MVSDVQIPQTLDRDVQIMGFQCFSKNRTYTSSRSTYYHGIFLWIHSNMFSVLVSDVRVIYKNKLSTLLGSTSHQRILTEYAHSAATFAQTMTLLRKQPIKIVSSVQNSHWNSLSAMSETHFLCTFNSSLRMTSLIRQFLSPLIL